MRHWLLALVVACTLCLGFAQSSFAQDDFDFENEFDDSSTHTQIADPLKDFNVLMYRFNDKLYFVVLKPAASFWARVMPEEGRRGIYNFFLNLRAPIRIVNNLVQLKFKGATVEFNRFVVNTTLGCLGVEDVAERLYNWKPYDEDLGQTIGHYGAGPGFYIVWPFLGPSSARDTVGMVGDTFLDPVTWVTSGTHVLVRPAIRVGETVNKVSLHPTEYEDLKKDAVDPYTFIRDAYHQNREKDVKE